VDWGEPFSSILAAFRVIVFDLDLIQYECIASPRPVSRYAAKVSAMPFLLLSYSAIAAGLAMPGRLKTMLKAGGVHVQFQTWTNGAGTLMLICFISLAVISAEPFRCIPHPSGETTLHSYMDILCGTARTLIRVPFL